MSRPALGEPPAWLPDWRDKSSYPAGLSLVGWAWEFLRRNVEYQKDYKHYDSLPYYYPEGHKTPKYSGSALSDEFQYYYCDPPSLDGETFDEYCSRTKFVFEMLPLEEHLMNKWGILHLCDPADNVAELFSGYGDYLSDIPPHIFNLENIHDFFVEGIDDSYVLLRGDIQDSDDINNIFIRFDLRYSIDSQIERARLILNYNKEMRRYDYPEIFNRRESTHSDKSLLNFLRAFDGKWSGATKKEIAEILFPEKEREIQQDSGIKGVNYALRHANELIFNRGYLRLIRASGGEVTVGQVFI